MGCVAGLLEETALKRMRSLSAPPGERTESWGTREGHFRPVSDGGRNCSGKSSREGATDASCRQYKSRRSAGEEGVLTLLSSVQPYLTLEDFTDLQIKI